LYIFERPVFDESVQQHAMASAILREDRHYLVHLPQSYKTNPTQRYPVIYVLDGSSQDVHTAASAALMARIGVTPEMIVVGIPNVSGTGRQRDYTPPGMRQDIDAKDSPEGRADAFLAFIDDELVPEINKSYRTSSTRVLAGNSRGGLFVLHAFMTDPSMFNAYIANSPALWRDDNEIVKRLDRFLRRDSAPRTSIFLSMGGNENDKMKDAFRQATATLNDHAPLALRWRSEFTPGASHSNNAELATPIALRWALDPGWQPVEFANKQ
jgi:predicted alpha/beta superfamily hydrolase